MIPGTSFANALLAEGAFCGERIVILEDTRELTCPAANLVALRTQDTRVTLRDLVRSTLRLRPDRIIVGEVRGAEALDLLTSSRRATSDILIQDHSVSS